MATIEEIKNRESIALQKLTAAEEELKKFNEGEDDGVLLKKLRRKLVNEEWKNEICHNSLND